MRSIAISLLCVAGLFSTQAQARHHHRVAQPSHCTQTFDAFQMCNQSPNFLQGVRSIQVEMTRVEQRAHRRHRRVIAYAPSYPLPYERPISAPARHVEAQVIGGRPSGCPYQYCGCFASLEVFGRIIPSLNLAVNWGRFPPAAPAPGHVAYRRHHVFVIREVYGDGTVLAADGNSGRHLSRIHRVSLHGYRVVNPRG